MYVRCNRTCHTTACCAQHALQSNEARLPTEKSSQQPLSPPYTALPLNSSILPRATLLPFVQVLKLRQPPYSFPVINSRFACIAVHVVFASHAFHINLQMELTHARQDDLA